jgi:hypothetical protein
MGWRAYIAPDPEEEREGEIFMFCPVCAQREFGPVGWEAAQRSNLERAPAGREDQLRTGTAN